MKILLVARGYSVTGGIGRYVRDLARELEARGSRVLVLHDDDPAPPGAGREARGDPGPRELVPALAGRDEARRARGGERLLARRRPCPGLPRLRDRGRAARAFPGDEDAPRLRRLPRRDALPGAPP